MFVRKLFLPWTAGDCFDSDDAFDAFLRRRHRQFTNARMVFVILAAVLLIAGYFIDRRPVMLAAIAPLLAVLGASMALDRIEAILGPTV